MKSMGIRILLAYFLVSFSYSCSKDKSYTNQLEDSVCVNLFADLRIIKEENRVLKEDSTTFKHKIDSLYRFYNTSESQANDMINFFKTDIIRWKEFNTKILKRLEYLQQKELNKQSQ